jgi:hypothetical protein
VKKGLCDGDDLLAAAVAGRSAESTDGRPVGHESRAHRGRAVPHHVATSIPALLLYDPVLDGTNFITGTGSEASVLVGAFLEVLLIIANIGTAVVLFPILKRQSETLALGYVTARIVECIFIAVGILALLAIVTLRQDIAGDANPATLDALGRALVAIKDWTFLLGPGFVVGVENGLMLGYLMYRSGLVPRQMACWGSSEAR